MKAILFITLQTFFAMHMVLKIGELFSDIPHFSLENIWSHDVFRPIVCKQKYLMDYK